MHFFEKIAKVRWKWGDFRKKCTLKCTLKVTFSKKFKVRWVKWYFQKKCTLKCTLKVSFSQKFKVRWVKWYFQKKCTLKCTLKGPISKKFKVRWVRWWFHFRSLSKKCTLTLCHARNTYSVPPASFLDSSAFSHPISKIFTFLESSDNSAYCNSLLLFLQ